MKKALLCLFASVLFSQDCAYLPPAKRCTLPQNTPSDIYFSLDFLYWEGTERGLEYALKNTGSLFQQEIQIVEPSFGFEPAFRVGAGTHLSYDHWDLEFAYTRFYNDTSTHTQASSPGGIEAVWTSSTAFQGNNYRAFWQNGQAHWKIHSHFFDLVLKNRLSLSCAITIEPTFGLKLAFLQQRYSVLYENGNTTPSERGAIPLQFISSSVAMKNRSFNLGPTAALSTRWNVWNYFDVLGSLSGSLCAAQFNVGRNESDVMLLLNTSSLSFDSVRERDNYWTLRPQAAATFGFGWTGCSSTCKSAIAYGLSACYEAQVWWKQNMLFRFIDQTNAAMIAPTQGDLFFQGLTLDAFLDF